MFLGLASIAVASQLNISTLTGLCAPITKDRSFRIGFTQEKSLGNGGEFIYPNENLVATSLLIPDIHSLSHADPGERKKMMDLRQNWSQTNIETTRRGEVHVIYDLEIPNITATDTVRI
jgi:hypothetical protein